MYRTLLILFLSLAVNSLLAQFPKGGMTLLHMMRCDKQLRGQVNSMTLTTKRFNPFSKSEITSHYGDGNQILQSKEKSAFVNEHSEYIYSDQGLLLFQTTKSKNELIDSIVGFYDELGRLTNMAIYNGNERELTSIDKIHYNKNNIPIKVRTGFPLGTRTQELVFKGGEECTIKHRIRNGAKKVAVVYNQKFKYDEIGQCLDFSERNIRNANGQRTVELYLDPETLLQTWVEIEYDDRGNWITKTGYRFDENKKVPKRGKLYEISREFTYR